MDVLCGANYSQAPGVPWWRFQSDCHVDLLNIGVAGVYTVLLIVSAVCYGRCSAGRGSAARALLLLLLCLVHGAELGEAVLAGGPPHAAAAPAASLLLVLAAMVLSPCRPRGLGTTLWIIAAIARVVRAKHLLAVGVTLIHVRLPCAAVATGVQVLLGGVEAATLCRSNEDLEPEDELPEVYRHSSASLYSKATFYWLTSLLRVGYSNPLELEDLGHLPQPESTLEQSRKFQAIYCEEKNSSSSRGKRVSLWKCYIRSCWRLFALGGLFKLLGDFVGFVGPLGISIILDYVARLQLPESEIAASMAGIVPHSKLYYPTWWEFITNGYIMAVIIFLSAIAQGTFSQSSTHLVNVEGIHLKGALQALVYDKALHLCVWTISDHKEGADRQEDSGTNNTANGQLHQKIDQIPSKTSATTDVGTITNLMSEDAFNVMSFFWIGHYIWAIPLKIAVLMYLLYQQLGLSAIAGATFCILMMTPLQFIIGKNMSANNKAVTEASDERLRQTNELLQGMKLLKLYGWEDVYGNRILATRSRELNMLDRDSIYWALMSEL